MVQIRRVPQGFDGRGPGVRPDSAVHGGDSVKPHEDGEA
jgi:hypothetical protein